MSDEAQYIDFLEQHRNFRLKVMLEGCEGEVRPIYIGEIIPTRTYQALFHMVVSLGNADPRVKVNDPASLSMSYVDVDNCKCTIGCTRELVHAVKDNIDKGYVIVAARFVANAFTACSSPPSQSQARKRLRTSEIDCSGKHEADESTTASSSQTAEGDNIEIRNKICTSMMELFALGIGEPSRTLVALLSGYVNRKTAQFYKPLSALMDEGLLHSPTKSNIALTEKGIRVLPKVVPPLDNIAFQERLCVSIARKKKHTLVKRVFNFLKDGKVHSYGNVAAATGHTNPQVKDFTDAISTLESLELVEFLDQDSIMLTKCAFPYGRPTNAT